MSKMLHAGIDALVDAAATVARAREDDGDWALAVATPFLQAAAVVISEQMMTTILRFMGTFVCTRWRQESPGPVFSESAPVWQGDRASRPRDIRLRRDRAIPAGPRWPRWDRAWRRGRSPPRRYHKTSFRRREEYAAHRTRVRGQQPDVVAGRQEDSVRLRPQRYD